MLFACHFTMSGRLGRFCLHQDLLSALPASHSQLPVRCLECLTTTFPCHSPQFSFVLHCWKGSTSQLLLFRIIWVDWRCTFPLPVLRSVGHRFYYSIKGTANRLLYRAKWHQFGMSPFNLVPGKPLFGISVKRWSWWLRQAASVPQTL